MRVSERVWGLIEYGDASLQNYMWSHILSCTTVVDDVLSG